MWAASGNPIYPSWDGPHCYTIGAGGCCLEPLRGDIDYNGLAVIDIADLVYLVDYMFTSGPAPQCWMEANVDCSDAIPPNGIDGPEDIDISDLVFLVDYMFTQGRPPCLCDCSDCVKDGSSSKAGEDTRLRWSSHVTHHITPLSGSR